MKIAYKKPPLSTEEQAKILLKRGLKGINASDLETVLKSVNYYRLRGYTYPYQNNAGNDSSFLENSHWGYVWNDYVLDSQLRALIFESIGHIEIAFRTQLELVMSLKYGSRWYCDSSYFHDTTKHKNDLEELLKDWKYSSEDFKKHYESKYDNSLEPPAWMIFETATFGLTSKFYNNIKYAISEKSEIAKFFGFSKPSVKILESWIRHLNTVRNICAHHSRLFSRVNITRPKFPRDITGKWVSSWVKDDRIYASICIIKKLLDICYPKFDFMTRLKLIINKFRKEQFVSMGIPENWETEDLFQ